MHDAVALVNRLGGVVAAVNAFEETLRLAVLDCRRALLDPDADSTPLPSVLPYDYFLRHSREREAFVALLHHAAHGESDMALWS